VIALLVTGGTFDKEYNELNGQLYFHDTHLHEMLRLGRSLLPTRIETLMLVDSLEMTGAQRQQVAQACRSAPEDQIVVTHGTDTMVETAALLAREVPGKTIVLTGAMVPWKFGSSDGLFNLGSAMAFVQSLPVGVYLSMNGRCFAWDNVRKNKSQGIFETL
jgi:L-asparaginase